METMHTFGIVRPKIDQFATHENAKAYEATSDKFVFCIDLLGLTAAEVDESETLAHLVASLEDRFDDLNATHRKGPALLMKRFKFGR